MQKKRSKLSLNINRIKPQDQTSGAARTKITKKYFPALSGMSLYKLVLYKGGVREPHWHPNADELGYCMSGKALVTLFGNNNLKETFLVGPGEVFLIPSGFLHHIENVGEKNCELILQFSHEEPEDFGISSALGYLSDAVLGNTWSVKANTFKALERSTQPAFASLRTMPPTISLDAHYPSVYKYSLESAQPLIAAEGGLARVARKDVWPIVKRQALYTLHLSGLGMREPHWHPETCELGYIREGRGRISVLHPSGKIDTFEINPGDVYFIPKAYPHVIENLSKKELIILVFFDQAMPGDIGYSASTRAYSSEVMGATMDIDPLFFNQLPRYYADRFIVKRTNPV